MKRSGRFSAQSYGFAAAAMVTVMATAPAAIAATLDITTASITDVQAAYASNKVTAVACCRFG